MRRVAFSWLIHPVTVLALGVLLVNDHFLKAAHPGRLTGNLHPGATIPANARQRALGSVPDAGARRSLLWADFGRTDPGSVLCAFPFLGILTTGFVALSGVELVGAIALNRRFTHTTAANSDA